MAEQVQAHLLKRYTLVKKVGSGAYGHVWRVTDKRTGEVLALKKIFDAFQHSTDAQRTFREITLLHQLDHPNIIKLHQVVRAENDKDLYLVFEFMEADLHNAIGQKILKDSHNRFILYQLAKGIKFLHSAEIIHRDLKPSNLLLNSDCTIKICDFGLARSLTADKSRQDVVLTQEVATRWYRAPQVLLGSHDYDKSADVWSMGCILAEVLLGKPIFAGTSTLNQLEKILSFTGKPSRQDVESLNAESAFTMMEQVSQTKQKPMAEWFKPGTPAEAISLVISLLQFNPLKRPTAVDILRSSYLASFSNPKQEIESRRIIKPPISDNTKLSLKDYRIIIYDHIRKVYRERDGQLGQSESNKKLQRPNTASKYDNTSAVLPRASSNNGRAEKPRTSETNKTLNANYSSVKVNTSSASCYDDEERIKKKSSLKEILKNKKPLIAYRPIQKSVSMAQSVKKFSRESEHVLLKENRTEFVKF